NHLLNLAYKINYSTFVKQNEKFMKRMTLLIGLIICSISLLAQVTISGKVKDNRGRALQGASVSLKDTYDGAVADSLGNFKFTTTEKGDHILNITISGYKTFEQKITI